MWWYGYLTQCNGPVRWNDISFVKGIVLWDEIVVIDVRIIVSWEDTVIIPARVMVLCEAQLYVYILWWFCVMVLLPNTSMVLWDDTVFLSYDV